MTKIFSKNTSGDIFSGKRLFIKTFSLLIIFSLFSSLVSANEKISLAQLIISKLSWKYYVKNDKKTLFELQALGNACTDEKIAEEVIEKYSSEVIEHLYKEKKIDEAEMLNKKITCLKAASLSNEKVCSAVKSSENTENETKIEEKNNIKQKKATESIELERPESISKISRKKTPLNYKHSDEAEVDLESQEEDLSNKEDESEILKSMVRVPYKNKTSTSKRINYVISKPLIDKAPDQFNQKLTEMDKTVRIQRQKSVSLRDISKVKVTIDFRDVEIADMVRLLAAKANLNIVSRNTITGRTTVAFDNVPAGVVLETILTTNDYLFEVKDGIIWVFKRGEENLETRVFFLKNVSASELFPIIERNMKKWEQVKKSKNHDSANSSGNNSANASAISSPNANAGASSGANSAPPKSGAENANTGNTETASMQPTEGQTPTQNSAPAAESAGESASKSQTSSNNVLEDKSTISSENWSLQLDERSNSLLLTAPRSKLDEMEELVKVFDKPLQNRNIQERVFKVKYLGRDTLEKAIKMVMPNFDPAKQMLDVKRNDTAGNTSGASGGAPAK
ncbi:MAG: hypothetical protein HQM10_10735 [Candidatus Riflebacteria bacterium]|nr:hypothetical protein [Candidatus Riflebacteria bacterium]